MKKPIELSVVIVSYNTRELLRQCLRSLGKKPNWEIIVVDNGSADGSREEAKKYKAIFNAQNLGFAKANNQGIKIAKGKYILLLNSDTEASPDAVAAMVQFMDEHNDAGAATCKVILPDGTPDPACHRGFPTPWAAFTYFAGLEKLFPKSELFGQYHQGYKDRNTVHEIDSPSGAFFLVRRKVIDDVGMLDEHYFMYAEDLDWAYRIKVAGWKIYYNPAVSILHKKKQSGRAHEDESRRVQTEKYFYQTMKLFYEKHYAKRYGWFMTQLVLLGIKLRSFL